MFKIFFSIGFVISPEKRKRTILFIYEMSFQWALLFKKAKQCNSFNIMISYLSTGTPYFLDEAGSSFIFFYKFPFTQDLGMTPYTNYRTKE